MTSTDNILNSLERRLREAREEIDRLTAARAALDGGEPLERTGARRPSATMRGGKSAVDAAPPDTPGGETPAPKPARKPRRRTRRSSRPTRAREVVPAGKLELLLSESGGLATRALAERANGDRDQILTLLRELETAGRVRRSGQRRATRWHLITDEERIEQRAAELSARTTTAT